MENPNGVGTAFALGTLLAENPAANVGTDERNTFALLPPGYQAASLEHLQDAPNRIRGNTDFRDIRSIAAYLDRFEGPDSIAMADWRDNRIRVAIDYHAKTAPSHNTHSATFIADQTPAWQAWRALHRKPLSQVDLGMFIEERAHEIVKPDSASMMDLVLNFEAHRSVKFRSSVRINSGLRQLQYEEDDQTKGVIPVPEKIEIRVPIFDGMEPDKVEARFRYRINDGKLSMMLHFDNLEDVERIAFERCVDALQVARKDLLIVNTRGSLYVED